MITQIPNCMNGARTLKINQDGAAPGRHRPISTTGGQPLITRCTRGYKRPTTEYNKKIISDDTEGNAMECRRFNDKKDRTWTQNEQREY